MRTTASKRKNARHRVMRILLAAGCVVHFATLCKATPYNPMTTLPNGGVVGSTIPAAADVPGKEFSNFADRNAAGVGDLEQQIAWDGLGGVRDAFDYSGSRPPNLDFDIETDAIANQNDALFGEVENDLVGLVFSVTGNNNAYVEQAVGAGNPPMSASVWAAFNEFDNMNTPTDIDGLELWGSNAHDDADRYSVAGDPFFNTGGGGFKVAVWQFMPGPPGTSAPHTFTFDLAMAMDLQFGGNGTGALFGQLVELMDVDALMVNGERLIYSIAPLDLSPLGLPNFDGGEIFVYDGPGSTTRFLRHGGHLWNTAFDIVGTYGNIGVNDENINAIEGVAAPEPSTIALTLMLVAALGCLSPWRRNLIR